MLLLNTARNAPESKKQNKPIGLALEYQILKLCHSRVKLNPLNRIAPIIQTLLLTSIVLIGVKSPMLLAVALGAFFLTVFIRITCARIDKRIKNIDKELPHLGSENCWKIYRKEKFSIFSQKELRVLRAKALRRSAKAKLKSK